MRIDDNHAVVERTISGRGHSSIGAIALCVVLAACGDNGNDKPVDAAPDDGSAVDTPIDANPLMPTTLRDTGLCDDPGCQTINAGILEYAPRYQLYSDGATKRRWIQVPAGMTIDTTDMNYWKFPVGTKVWKEFTRGGTRVETRFIQKIGDDDTAQASWYFASFVWDAAQTSSTFYDPQMGNPNANGTEHDVPSRFQCRSCHMKQPGIILGFGALQLDFTAPAGHTDLQDLVDTNALSTNPTGTAPFFPLPGNDVDKAAFGFMHANCGGCHNPHSPVHDVVVIEMRMDVTKLATTAMHPAYDTLVGKTAQLSLVSGTLAIPDNPTDSVVIKRMTSLTNGVRMPEIGTETINDDGVAAVTAWINQLP